MSAVRLRFQDPAAVLLCLTPLQTEYGNHLLRRINLSSGLVMTLAGGGRPSNKYGHADGTGTAASFYAPHGVALDGPGTFAIVVRMGWVCSTRECDEPAIAAYRFLGRRWK